MASVSVDFEGHVVSVPAGARILELVGRRTHPRGVPVGAFLNRRVVGLNSEVWPEAKIETIYKDDPQGVHIFRRSLCLLLYAGFQRVAPAVRVWAGQTLGDWLYFEAAGVKGEWGDLLAKVEEEMRGMIGRDEPFEFTRTSTDNAARMFEEEKRGDKADLLRHWWHESVKLVRVAGYGDIALGPTVPAAGYLTACRLHPYGDGFVLGFSPRGTCPGDDAPPVHPKLLATYRETKDWNRALGVSSVGDLNRVCVTNEYRDVIGWAEGFHEKKIAAIADQIGARRDRVRLVLVAGPSSSGKTTFTKRLLVQLRVVGLRPVALSTDDYYVDRERTSVGEDGRPDFEALESVDLELFNRHLADLLAGREVWAPRYDFQSGRRAPEGRWSCVRLRDGDVLIVEGIHALNERLTASVPTEAKFRIYASALTQLSIDAENRISTSDTRLLRRIVRDRLYRNHTAAATLASWPAVRRGEQKWIFPYQESADVIVNTALVYETAALKVYATRYLLEVPPDDPGFAEAYRLLKFLELFVPIFPDKVPQNSIIREFVGGSSFHY